MYNCTSKARKALPDDPEQYATVVHKLVNYESPRKRKAIEDVGIEVQKTAKQPRFVLKAFSSLPTAVNKMLYRY